MIVQRLIPAGEQIFTAYVDPNADVGERRSELLQGYGFFCECAKCLRDAGVCDTQLSFLMQEADAQ